MHPVTLISGAPGSGKTTLSRALAQAHPAGLHLESDVFYTFIAHPLDPATPASRSQNEAVMRSLGAAAAEFARSGYAVFLEGVIGPWMLPLLQPSLAELDTRYVVLATSEAEALRRVRDRQGSGLSPVVRHMHRQFAASDTRAKHLVSTLGCSPEEVEAEVGRLLDSGRFVVDWPSSDR